MQASKEEMQKAFEDCVLLLWKQDSISLNGKMGSYGCAYRGDNCTKCAIGFLIPDNEYMTDFEGYSIFDLYKKDNLPTSLAKFYIQYLSGIQRMHDSIFEYSDFRTQLMENAQSFAKDWNLQMPTLPSENHNG